MTRTRSKTNFFCWQMDEEMELAYKWWSVKEKARLPCSYRKCGLRLADRGTLRHHCRMVHQCDPPTLRRQNLPCIFDSDGCTTVAPSINALRKHLAERHRWNSNAEIGGEILDELRSFYPPMRPRHYKNQRKRKQQLQRSAKSSKKSKRKKPQPRQRKVPANNPIVSFDSKSVDLYLEALRALKLEECESGHMDLLVTDFKKDDVDAVPQESLGLSADKRCEDEDDFSMYVHEDILDFTNEMQWKNLLHFEQISEQEWVDSCLV